jgi:hypothetical protein
VSVDICSLFVPIMDGDVKCRTAAERGGLRDCRQMVSGRFDEDWTSSFARAGEQS